MINLGWILLYTAFSAAWFVASGFLSYAWSNGDERRRARFMAVSLALYFAITYLVFMY
jgi:hypothetical protein